MSGPQRLLLELALLAYPADFRKSFRDEIVADIEEMRANPFTAARRFGASPSSWPLYRLRSRSASAPTSPYSRC